MLSDMLKNFVSRLRSEASELEAQRKTQQQVPTGPILPPTTTTMSATGPPVTTYQHFKPPVQHTQTIASPKVQKPAVVVAYEGALASVAWRDQYIDKDEPDWESYWNKWERDCVNPQVLEMLQLLDGDTEIIVMTNHAGGWYQQIDAWCKENGVPKTRIITNYHPGIAKDIARSKLLDNLKNTCTVQAVIEADPACMEMEAAMGYVVIPIDDPKIDPKPDPKAELPPVTDQVSETDEYVRAMWEYAGWV